MNKPVERGANKAVDSIQQSLTDYACGLRYDALPPEVVHTAKVRIIDTLGVIIGGFFGAPCRIARSLAAQMPNPAGATVVGTRMKTTPDMAAFVNGTATRYLDFSDVYHYPGSTHGHPSDVISAVLAAAEHAQQGGRDFITGVVLAYEIYGHISDIFKNSSFDNANYCCVAAAVAAGKMLCLPASQLSHCIAMAAVPNNVLKQVRKDYLSMWKEVASGHAGRSAVFAALLARAGMEGPHLPFEGKAGWCDHVAGIRFSLNSLGSDFKILHTNTRHRPAMGETHASIFAAEKMAPLQNLKEVQRVTVETYQRAKEHVGTGEQFWNPDSREMADHSIPYVVAATLMDGTLSPRSFNDAHLWNPELRALMQKIEVVANEEFTKAVHRVPREQRARITVVTASGERKVQEAGGGPEDLAAPKTDAQIIEKFRGLTEDLLGAKQVSAILDSLWHLEDVENVAAIPSAFALD